MLPNPGEIFEYDFELFDWNDVAKSVDPSIAILGDLGFRTILEGGRVPTLAVHEASVIPQVKIVKDIIDARRRPKYPLQVNCHIYASMSKESDVFGYHDDGDDTYIWQVWGNTDWSIPQYNVEHTLQPNQMIYIPAGVKHRAILTGPRISVSFSLGT